jgi:transposase
MGGEELVVGQEVGTMAYLVHDAITAAGAEVLSFNAQQLRMIASSRKKTDRRDAYWIARALQTGMYPHPVYIPTGEIRELRGLLRRRRLLLSERTRWHKRGRATLRAAGQPVRCSPRRLGSVLEETLRSADGVDAYVAEMIELAERQRARLDGELQVGGGRAAPKGAGDRGNQAPADDAGDRAAHGHHDLRLGRRTPG